MEKKYVLAIDQRTTSCRAILFDKESRILGIAQKEFPQYYPQNGWVEHDPEEIWSTQIGVIAELLAHYNVNVRDIIAIRAALESIAYQTKDVLTAMENESGLKLKMLKVDGGAVTNNLLMQFQADILGVKVERSTCVETSALGAAYLAGLATGFWSGENELTGKYSVNRSFEPQMSEELRNKYYKGWHKAVSRVRDWETED